MMMPVQASASAAKGSEGEERQFSAITLYTHSSSSPFSFPCFLIPSALLTSVASAAGHTGRMVQRLFFYQGICLSAHSLTREETSKRE